MLEFVELFFGLGGALLRAARPLLPYAALLLILYVARLYVEFKYASVPPVRHWRLGIPLRKMQLTPSQTTWLYGLNEQRNERQTVANTSMTHTFSYIAVEPPLGVVRVDAPRNGPLFIGLLHLKDEMMQVRVSIVHLLDFVVRLGFMVVVLPILLFFMLLVLGIEISETLAQGVVVALALGMLLMIPRNAHKQGQKMLAYIDEEMAK